MRVRHVCVCSCMTVLVCAWLCVCMCACVLCVSACVAVYVCASVCLYDTSPFYHVCTKYNQFSFNHLKYITLELNPITCSQNLTVQKSRRSFFTRLKYFLSTAKTFIFLVLVT